jgi:hypothetical protein
MNFGEEVMTRSILNTAAVGLLLCASVGMAEAASYGCFKVTADTINIRARPYSNAEVVGTASKGDILEKRKLICTPRGFWCAIRKGTLEGYADKSLMTKIACP